jgi:NAD(P)-dependent dehydrogenase (short-subunit alcohol dehydrogenase family)
MVRTALVTGANRGIGLALCAELKKRGRQVIAEDEQVEHGDAVAGREAKPLGFWK